MNIFKTIPTVFLFTILTGCATGSLILTGEVRPAINPTEVKIYLDPPSQYETIGIVEASGEVEFSKQKTQDKVINKLKSQAAKIGANGVLLVNTGSQSSGTTGFYSNGVFFAGTSNKITTQGRAIYVIEE